MPSDFRVPRGLLVGSVAADRRIAEERRILRQYFPQFSLTVRTNSADAGVAKGSLTTFANVRYPLRITLPAGFPHRVPLVYGDGWQPQPNPHMYTDNRICIMRDEQWMTLMSVAFIVAKSALWLNKYEIYLDKRVWPGPEQHEHGPLYKLRKWWHEL